ncbi:MAG: MFS transporter [Rhodospirillales bacterium]|nr:MFS transporter [Rhodospirillales bacterium]
MRNIHLPVWLGARALPRPATFVALFTLAVLPRTLLITVLPLEALAFLGSAQKVSVLYLCVSLVGLCGSLSIPWMVHRLRRRWVFSLGALSMASAALLFTFQAFPVFVAGMVLHVFAVASLEISLNLYLMDHVPRRELNRFEPLRVFFAGSAFTLGPWLGVYVRSHLDHGAPFALTALAALVLFGYFWFLRLTENPVVAPMKRPPPKPLVYLPRFFGQPRLRLAWVLAVGRSAWWSMFFIYAPIYAVTSGLGEIAGGAIVSAGSACVFLAPLWGRLGRRFGMRRLLVGGYVAGGLTTMAVAAIAGAPWLGAAALLLAAFATGSIDGAGNLPFLRAVHPLERPEMTTVFATYRDAAQLAPPGIFSVLLRFFELPAVFAAGGAALLVLSYYARFIPRRL